VNFKYPSYEGVQEIERSIPIGNVCQSALVEGGRITVFLQPVRVERYCSDIGSLKRPPEIETSGDYSPCYSQVGDMLL